jgi:hypothetical protein
MGETDQDQANIVAHQEQVERKQAMDENRKWLFNIAEELGFKVTAVETTGMAGDSAKQEEEMRKHPNSGDFVISGRTDFEAYHLEAQPGDKIIKVQVVIIPSSSRIYDTYGTFCVDVESSEHLAGTGEAFVRREELEQILKSALIN